MRILIVCVCVLGNVYAAQAVEQPAGNSSAAPEQRMGVVFGRESGDEYFYSLQAGKDAGCMIAQGDELIFSGPGIVKGLVAPFRDAAKKECGAWRASKKSAPGRVVFEASSEALLHKPCDGFILTGRMGSPRNDDGKRGMVGYECAGKGCASQGKLPGPVAVPDATAKASAGKAVQ